MSVVRLLLFVLLLKDIVVVDLEHGAVWCLHASGVFRGFTFPGGLAVAVGNSSAHESEPLCVLSVQLIMSDIAPTGGLRAARTNANLASSHTPTQLIARLQERQRPKLSTPTTTGPCPAALAASERYCQVLSPCACMAKLREELDKAVLEMEAAHKARVATKASLCDRPPPVLLPSEDDSRGGLGSSTLPRSREKKIGGSPAASAVELVRVWHDSDDDSDDTSAHESDDLGSDQATGGSKLHATDDGEPPCVAYALTPEGFAIYVDTPLRKLLDEVEESEQEEDDDEGYDEDDDEEPSQRRPLGELNMNNFIEY